MKFHRYHSVATNHIFNLKLKFLDLMVYVVGKPLWSVYEVLSVWFLNGGGHFSFHFPRLHLTSKQKSLVLVKILQMYEKYGDYATDSEKEVLSIKLQETEDWLYEEGEDETKGVYIAKLAELKKVGHSISTLPLSSLKLCLNML